MIMNLYAKDKYRESKMHIYIIQYSTQPDP